MKRFIKIVVSYEPLKDCHEDDSFNMISMDLEQEISSCWHGFNIESIEIMEDKEDSP